MTALTVEGAPHGFARLRTACLFDQPGPRPALLPGRGTALHCSLRRACSAAACAVLTMAMHTVIKVPTRGSARSLFPPDFSSRPAESAKGLCARAALLACWPAAAVLGMRSVGQAPARRLALILR